MSNVKASEDQTQETSGSSLIKIMEDISQYGCAQKEDLKEKEMTLSSLQAILSDLEKKGETAEQELRSKSREILMLEGDMELLERQKKVLQHSCASISKENTELQVRIREEEDSARVVLAGFNTYRNKMEAHRAAVFMAASHTEAYKELEEKRALVRKLTQKKEELKEDLENPNGKSANMAKEEIDALKDEISVMRKTIAERKEQLQKEFETHTQIKKDIATQNRRYGAIVRHLHYQLSMTKAVYRQISEEIHYMRGLLDELKEQQESSQDPGDRDH